MREHDSEPVRGLPERLPQGERIVWQGSPDPRALARAALHVRAVGVYFALLVAWGVASGAFVGAAITALFGIGVVGLLHLLAWAMARSTVYTVTDKRIVLRFGVALRMCVNIPMACVETARLKLRADGSGDIALKLNAPQGAGYLMLWPHARPLRFGNPEPSLRGLGDAQAVATLLARTMANAVPGGRRVLADESAAPAPARAVAA